MRMSEGGARFLCTLFRQCQAGVAALKPEHARTFGDHISQQELVFFCWLWWIPAKHGTFWTIGGSGTATPTWRVKRISAVDALDAKQITFSSSLDHFVSVQTCRIWIRPKMQLLYRAFPHSGTFENMLFRLYRGGTVRYLTGLWSAEYRTTPKCSSDRCRTSQDLAESAYINVNRLWNIARHSRYLAWLETHFFIRTTLNGMYNLLS